MYSCPTVWTFVSTHLCTYTHFWCTHVCILLGTCSFSLVQFRQHSFWFICASLLLLAHICHSLAFVCTHSCPSVTAAGMCLLSFTLICSYLYTDLLSPIGFFLHLSRPPVVLAGTRLHSFVLTGTYLCSFACSKVCIALWEGGLGVARTTRRANMADS